MGLPGCCARDEEEWIFYREGVEGGRGVLGEIAWGVCYRELCLQGCPLIAVFLCRAEWDTMASRQKQNRAPGGVVSPRGRSSSFVVSNGGVGALRF